MTLKHVVHFSGGICSWAAAKRVAERHGTANMVLLFADTRMEDEDLYRFIGQAAEEIGVPLTVIADGRTPWQIFRDEKFLGNSRIDPCSKILKRQLLDRWAKKNCGPDDEHYIGLDWTELHRLEPFLKAVAPTKFSAPMCDKPYVDKDQMLAALKATGIKVPRLYEMGFPHNNCGGFCVKAGQAHFKLLLERMPDRYAFHEAQEEALRAQLGKPVSILLDRRGGAERKRRGEPEGAPMSLREFRERVQGGQAIDEHEWGGCGCALPNPLADFE